MKFLLILPLLVGVSQALKCVFPFSYKGHTFTQCTDMNSNYLWCSPSQDYSGVSIPCDEDEVRQKVLRDNYSKLLTKLGEHTKALEELEKQRGHNNNSKCGNCKEELYEVKDMMPALDGMAGDHERRIAAASEEIERQIRRAERLIKASDYVQERAMKATRRRTQRTWYGTAPFCNGKCPSGYRHISTSKSGDGKSCWTGSKKLCERVYYV